MQWVDWMVTLTLPLLPGDPAVQMEGESLIILSFNTGKSDAPTVLASDRVH